VIVGTSDIGLKLSTQLVQSSRGPLVGRNKKLPMGARIFNPMSELLTPAKTAGN